jgi:UDP-N-acetylmuramyl pentapeptide phosphotransferase/UDP-N-acetylglucosamine-1-phosphate transferase
METLAVVSLSAFVIFLGIACVRVGLIGPHLGGAKLVSYVKKYPEEPQLHHRRITVGVGAVAILIGVGFLFLLFDVLPRTK